MSSAAVSNDVNSIDAILKAMYEVISGPAGKARDWHRFRALYAEGARLMPVVSLDAGAYNVRILTPEQYIERVEPIFREEHFWEVESHREAQVHGAVAHVLSYYVSVRAPGGAPFESGTNSVQLFHDGSRWWIVSVMWNTSRSA